jgi:hypothetical protein
MFDQLKSMGAVASLLRDKERMRQISEEFQAKLERISVTGVAGGSAVRVTVSGKLRVTDVFVDPAVIAGMNADDVTGGNGGAELAQTLIQDATNDALTRAQQRVAEEASRLAEELGLPDMPGGGLNKLLGA